MRSAVKVMAVMMVAVFSMAVTTESFARERNSSGSYKGRSGSGTFQRNIDREQGSVNKSTTWQNQRGQGSREVQRNWDKDTETGTYSSETTSAGEKTVSREGTVRRNEDGSFSQQGTITGPKGKTTDVSRSVTKNEDESHSVQTTYTGQDGKTATVEKTTIHQDGARAVTGSYQTNTGKSGTFTGQTVKDDGKIVSDRSLTNQNGQTWRQHAEVDKDGNTIIRDVTNTNPEGEITSFTQSVTIDEPPQAEHTENQ